MGGVPDEGGVHIVWDPDGQPLYVGYSTAQRSRLRQHISGDREASILHAKVGRELDTSESTANQEDIEAFLAACSFAWKTDEDPRGLKARLMEALEPRYNEINPPAPEDPWDDFIYWARRFKEWSGFDAQEYDFKLEIASNLAASREALASESPEWPQLLKRAFGSPNNLTHFITHGKYLDGVADDEEAAAAGLVALWDTTADIDQRLSLFLDAIPDSSRLTGVSNRLQIASFLLGAIDVEQHPIYRPTPFKAAVRLTGYEPFPTGTEVDTYDHALGFLDRILTEAEARDLTIRNRLDAQSVLWALMKSTAGELPFGADDDRFLRYRGVLAQTWWVNQGHTYQAEADGGFVWAPQATKTGAKLAHWLNVTKLQVDEPIIHYANGAIRALGRVDKKPIDRSKPDSIAAGAWEEDGYYCAIEYHPLDNPIELAEIPEPLRQGEAPTFNRNGGVNQAYLHPLSQAFADDLKERFADRWPSASLWGGTPPPVVGGDYNTHRVLNGTHE